MAGPLDSLLTQADSANPAVFAGGVPSLHVPKPAEAVTVTPARSTPSPSPGGGGFDMGSFVDRNMQLEGTGADPRSSAVSGFMPDTWLGQVRKNRPDLAALPDSQVLAMRNDPTLRRQMWATLAADNAASLTSAVVPPTATNLRLANWFGAQGAQQILSAPDSTPIEQLNFGKVSGPAVVAANPSLAGKTVGEVKSMVHEQMFGVGTPTVSDMAAQVQLVKSGQYAAAGKLDAIVGDLIRQIGKERGNLDDVMTRVRAAQSKADEANDAAQKAVTNAPPQPEINGFKQLNGLAVLVGVLGGIFTKSPMRTSVNAAASAIEAYNDHDREKYETSYKNWQTQTNLLFKIADMTQGRVRDILYAENMGANERAALLDTTLRAAGLSPLADKARVEGETEVLKWMETVYSAKIAHDERMAQIEATNEYRKAMLSLPKNQAMIVNQLVDQQDAELYAQTGQHMTADQRVEATKGIMSAMKPATPAAAEKADVNSYVDTFVRDYQAAHPDEKLSPDQITKLRLEGRAAANNAIKGVGVITDEAADIMAQQMILGDKGVLTSLPRSGPSRTKVENRFAEKLRNEPDAARGVVMNRLRMMEAESAARTAGRVTMQTEIFSKEAVDAGAEVVRTSKLVPRTDSPMFNRALQAFYRQEGDPDIIAFGAALNALVNAYGKMSNPTGTGVHDADKERLAHTIDTSLSQGQVEAGVNQIITEGRIISGAAQAAQATVLQGLAPTGLNPPSPAAAPASSATAPVVRSQSDYDKLPNGATYQGPDGKQYTKGK